MAFFVKFLKALSKDDDEDEEEEDEEDEDEDKDGDEILLYLKWNLFFKQKHAQLREKVQRSSLFFLLALFFSHFLTSILFIHFLSCIFSHTIVNEGESRMSMRWKKRMNGS